MAQKFGGSRWVKEGYLDNQIPGVVVGHVIFAAVGRIEFYLKGDFKPDIAGQIFSFCNTRFSDDPQRRFTRHGFGKSPARHRQFDFL